MKIKILSLLLLIPVILFAQEKWHPMGDDDFNRSSLGEIAGAGAAGRNPLIVKNGTTFHFNIQKADYPNNKFRFSVGKYADYQWEHFDFPFLFGSLPLIDCSVVANEIPYVFYNEVGTNLPKVKKYVSGNWVQVGNPISSLTSSFLNINIGTDNLPRILYQDGNFIKLKKFDGTNWNLISETNEFIPYSTISLELDNNNVPYVISRTDGATFVKKFNGTAWEEVGITGFTGIFRSFTFDNLNVPHLLFNDTIKVFNGLMWGNLTIPAIESYPYSVNFMTKLTFNFSNEMHVGYLRNYVFGGSGSFCVVKLINGVWGNVLENPFSADRVFAVDGDTTYYLTYGSSFRATVSKIANGQQTLLGGASFSQLAGSSTTDYSSPSGEIFTHDFSICNGIPVIAYREGGKASIKMFVNNNWTNLGPLHLSENEIGSVMIRSGTDGLIYMAYNNYLDTSGDVTKLTVKKFTALGWESVGSLNFSESAGKQFDFKLDHANVPHVLYMSGRVQKFDGANWVFVGGSAYLGDTPSRLAFDTNNVPYIAYRDMSNNGHIAVKKFNGTVWEYVDQAGLSSYTGWHYRPRIIVDATNNIYLGFSDGTLKVHIKKLINGGWEAVGSDIVINDSNHQYEIATDKNNVLYIAYNDLQDSFRREAKVKRFNGIAWEYVGEPNFSATSIAQAKLDFSANNTPVVVYSTKTGTFYDFTARYFGEENGLNTSEFPLISSNNSWLLAPNPVVNSFSIKGTTEIQLIDIYDLMGKKVHTINSNFNNIVISSLKTGIYIVKIKSTSGVSTVKLIKK